MDEIGTKASQIVQQIENLLKDGKKEEAINVVAKILKENKEKLKEAEIVHDSDEEYRRKFGVEKYEIGA